MFLLFFFILAFSSTKVFKSKYKLILSALQMAKEKNVHAMYDWLTLFNGEWMVNTYANLFITFIYVHMNELPLQNI